MSKTVIANPRNANRLFSNRNLQWQTKGNAGAAIISGVPAFGFPKMTNFVARISKPTFAAMIDNREDGYTLRLENR
jgi:hypothetical protein